MLPKQASNQAAEKKKSKEHSKNKLINGLQELTEQRDVNKTRRKFYERGTSDNGKSPTLLAEM